MPVAWNSDPPGSEGTIAANSTALVRSLEAVAGSRAAPTVSMAQDWHRQIYAGVPTPVPYYVGEFRDSDRRFPDLYGYEVAVGGTAGVLSADVPSALSVFENQAQAAVARTDANLAVGARPNTNDQLRAVLVLCAYLHGEWVRIHPFAYGNGRTARLWAVWAALRYGLPAFVRVKPRPEGIVYAAAARASMHGDHQLTVAVFSEMLNRRMRLGP